MSEISLGRSSIGAHWACDGCHVPGDPLGPSVGQLVLVTCLPRLASMRGLLQVQTEQRLQKGRVGFLVLIRIPGEGVQTEETLLLCPESLPFLQAGSWPPPPAPGGREIQPSDHPADRTACPLTAPANAQVWHPRWAGGAQACPSEWGSPPAVYLLTSKARPWAPGSLPARHPEGWPHLRLRPPSLQMRFSQEKGRQTGIGGRAGRWE